MFIGREKEVNELKKLLNKKGKKAVLVYGKRRVGKSTFLNQVAKDFDGVAIHHLCVQSSYAGNVALLSRSVCQALNLPIINFGSIVDLFDFIKAQNKRVFLIIDEYQYLKESLKSNEMDSLMQSIIDDLPENIAIVLCGSYISIMRELLEEANPLFGRFTLIMHIEEFDYYDSAKFYESISVYDKVAYYSVLGGSPFVLENIDSEFNLKENIISKLIPETGIYRTYIENVMLREIQKAYDVRILQAIGNGKKKYSELNDILSDKSNGLLDKQLKNLITMETIKKTYPINKKNDKKKQFYEISDNLMRFYFTYIFGNEALIINLGPRGFYERMIEPSIKTFISHRYENITLQYFKRQIIDGKMNYALNYGSYWYDNPKTKSNGEFDCVIERKDSYDLYECKYYEKPMEKGECLKEAEQVKAIAGMPIGNIGFVCVSGFNFKSDEWKLITGKDMFND